MYFKFYINFFLTSLKSTQKIVQTIYNLLFFILVSLSQITQQNNTWTFSSTKKQYLSRSHHFTHCLLCWTLKQAADRSDKCNSLRAIGQYNECEIHACKVIAWACFQLRSHWYKHYRFYLVHYQYCYAHSAGWKDCQSALWLNHVFDHHHHLHLVKKVSKAKNR